MSSLKDEFYDQLSGMVWSLWKELGVAGIEKFHSHCLIPIEELILFTVIVSKHDPRLRDEALDWCSSYHELISVSRLRTLLKNTSGRIENSFSEFSSALHSISSAKWPLGKEKPSFKVKTSGKSLLPSLSSPSLLALRLRSLLSPGAKADLLTWVLTKNKESFSASDLVEIGYSKRSLMTALDQLAAAGIFSITPIRNKKMYALDRFIELQTVIGILPDIAPAWTKLLQLVSAIDKVIPDLQDISETSKTIVFRKCLLETKPVVEIFLPSILSTQGDFTKDWKAMIEMLNAYKQGNFSQQFHVQNDFDTTLTNLLPHLYDIENCIDGIATLSITLKSHPRKYREVKKQCDQLFLTFISDLEITLEEFLSFPFHKIRSEPLSDIPYQFSKEKLPKILTQFASIKSTRDRAPNDYQMTLPLLDELKQLLYSFRKGLEELHFLKKAPPFSKMGNKRALVLDLFSLKS